MSDFENYGRPAHLFNQRDRGLQGGIQMPGKVLPLRTLHTSKNHLSASELWRINVLFAACVTAVTLHEDALRSQLGLRFLIVAKQWCFITIASRWLLLGPCNIFCKPQSGYCLDGVALFFHCSY